MGTRDGSNWIVIGDLTVCYFVAGPVVDLVWSRLCARIAKPETSKVLLASIGALDLDGTQRHELSDALSIAPMTKLAVVTDEAIVRGIMTATRWRQRVELKLFTWHKLPEVHSYLRPNAIDAQDLPELVESVRRRVEAQ